MLWGTAVHACGWGLTELRRLPVVAAAPIPVKECCLYSALAWWSLLPCWVCLELPAHKGVGVFLEPQHWLRWATYDRGLSQGGGLGA